MLCTDIKIFGVPNLILFFYHDFKTDSLRVGLDTAPEPPSPPSINLNSPKFDEPSMPSETLIANNDANLESHPNVNMLDELGNHLNNESDVQLKIEDREDLHLDFLDSLSDVDLENVESETNPINIKLEPSTNENIEEMRTLMKMHSEFLEKLERKKMEDENKKAQEAEKAEAGTQY